MTVSSVIVYFKQEDNQTEVLRFSGTQIASVQGGIDQCGSIDFPGIFIRFDDPKIHSFIFSMVEAPREEKGETYQKLTGLDIYSDKSFSL